MTTAKSGTSKAKGGDPTKKVIEAALDLAEERPWGEVRMSDIAKAAGLSLADLYLSYPSKFSILRAYGRQIDEAMLKAAAEEGVEDSEDARDRLFEVIMLRFELLQPRRAALASLVYAQRRDPLTLLCGAGALAKSLGWMLEAAGLGCSGLEEKMKIKALGLVYLSALRVFLKDESEDLAKTMARLDKDLKRAETLYMTLCSRVSRNPVNNPKESAA